jgi:hypothetical protein
MSKLLLPLILAGAAVGAVLYRKEIGAKVEQLTADLKNKIELAKLQVLVDDPQPVREATYQGDF